MNEHVHNAREELKRVDHLIYVSLKYTRTGDVLKSAVNRLVQSYDCIVDGFIEKLVDEKQLGEEPTVPLKKIAAIKEHFPDKERLHEGLDFYLFLRKVNNAEFSSFNEFRRHVTMVVEVNEESVSVTIDKVMGYYKDTLGYMDYMESLILDDEQVS